MKDINSYQVWTAIITPMNEDASIDYQSFERILKEQEAANNGLTVLGSTGEALNLDPEERKKILDFVIGLNLSVPIMVGVGGINIGEQLEWVGYLNTMDVDAYLLVVPPYAKPGVHGQYQWFKKLLDVAEKPCMLYNVPGRTAKKLEVKTVEMLADHPNFWAIKDASGSVEEFSEYATAAPAARMMSGEDGLLPAFCKVGCKGVVSVVSNVWPIADHEWASQCVSGSLQNEAVWTQVCKAIFVVSSPIPTKALLHDLGRIKTPTLRLPLSIEDMVDLSIVREANTAIEAWLDDQPQ